MLALQTQILNHQMQDRIERNGLHYPQSIDTMDISIHQRYTF